ncbi:breast carcinoma amplified sequence 2 [Panus rudis PR-1116 ss-1]|nr:breast carcinoma amplified sequence 2 [Panus rudis PR-1116 ss-1]
MSIENEQQGPAIFDSLPYYDNDLERDPSLKEKAEKLIAKEVKPQSELHPRVPPPIEIFANDPLLQAEMARIEARQPIPPLDTNRYQLPGPASSPGTEEEWRAALNNARSQLEHQRLRHSNLALLQNYGANAWRIENFLLEQTAKNLEKALEDLKELTVELNRDRKNFQSRIGNQLNTLETRWTELISSVLQIEMANVALEGKIDELSKKEAELASLTVSSS